MHQTRSIVAAFALAACAFVAAPAALAQQKSDISITRQPGIIYLPSLIMEKQQLIEKARGQTGRPRRQGRMAQLQQRRRADRRAAVGQCRHRQHRRRQPAAAVGPHQGRRQGHRRQLGAAAHADLAQPEDPVDQGHRRQRQDRRADGRVSTQAILLQMAAAQLYGPDHWNRLDANTVQLGHPDACGDAGQSATTRSRATSPRRRSRSTSSRTSRARTSCAIPDIIGGPLTQSQFFTTTKFADANPKIIEAIRIASDRGDRLHPQGHAGVGRDLPRADEGQDPAPRSSRR